MNQPLLAWGSCLLGLLVSLLLGYLVLPFFVERIRKLTKCDDDAWRAAGLPMGNFRAWIGGSCERLFFTVAYAFAGGPVVTAMMAYLAAKMLAGLSRVGGNAIGSPSGWVAPQPIVFDRTQTALLGTLVSLFFALLGGILCQPAAALVTEFLGSR